MRDGYADRAFELVCLVPLGPFISVGPTLLNMLGFSQRFDWT